jgi:hypothetical protein
MSAPPNAYVAVESFRPVWERLVACGRVSAEDHPTVARVMRDDQERDTPPDKDGARQALSLKIVDQVLVQADETFLLHQLYLVNRNGVPLSLIDRRREKRQQEAERRRQEREREVRERREALAAAKLDRIARGDRRGASPERMRELRDARAAAQNARLVA